VARDELRRDRVHHVLGVALHDRHGRLDLLHQSPLFRRLHESGEATLAKRVHELRGVGQRRQAARRAALDPHLERLHIAPHQAAHVLAQPRHALELEDVRELVRGDPAAERLGVHIQVAHRAGEVRAHEQEPRLGVGAEQRDVVLAKDTPGQVPHHEARLRGQRGGGTHLQRPGQRPGGALQPRVQPRGDRIEDVLKRLEVDRRPLGAADHFGGRRGPREREPRVAGHRRLHLGRQRGDVERRLLLGAPSRRQRGDLSGKRPFDHHQTVPG
jgi:hypothetical protein